MHKHQAKPLKAKAFYSKAVIAQGLHLLPFRTEKLNLATPMVLPTRESRKRPPFRASRDFSGLFLFWTLPTLLKCWAATLRRNPRNWVPLFFCGGWFQQCIMLGGLISLFESLFEYGRISCWAYLNLFVSLLVKTFELACLGRWACSIKKMRNS